MKEMDLDVCKIQKILPHRFPFLLVDRVTIEDMTAVGIKNVSINEWFFQGHFPDLPTMPGVLIIESMAQVGATMMMNLKEYRHCVPYFTTIDKVKMRRPVVPGDQLIITVELLKIRKRMGKLKGVARVKDTVVAEGEIGFSLVEMKEEEI